MRVEQASHRFSACLDSASIAGPTTIAGNLNAARHPAQPIQLEHLLVRCNPFGKRGPKRVMMTGRWVPFICCNTAR